MQYDLLCIFYLFIFILDVFFLSEVGFAKNRAVEQSCGNFLCFQDVVGEEFIFVKIKFPFFSYLLIYPPKFQDDVMHPERIYCQLQEAKLFPEAVSNSLKSSVKAKTRYNCAVIKNVHSFADYRQ